MTFAESDPHVIIFCGGSGLRDFFRSWFDHHRQRNAATRVGLHLVVPVTDDGGSSRELIRSVGGPAVGDLRNVTLAACVGAWGSALGARSWLSCAPLPVHWPSAKMTHVVESQLRCPCEIAPNSPGERDAARARCAVPLLKLRLSGDAVTACAELTEVRELLRRMCSGSPDSRPPSCSLQRIREALEIGVDATSARSPRCRRPLDLLNASIGNLVLVGLIIGCGERGCQLPLQSAIHEFGALAGLPAESCAVHANLDLASGTLLRVPMPCATISTILSDGTHFTSQRNFSYGIADDSDAHEHNTFAEPPPIDGTPQLGPSSAPAFVHSVAALKESGAFDHLCAKPVSVRIVTTATGVDSAQSDRCGDADCAFRPSEQVRQKIRGKAPAVVVFARGSFVTSTVAAALPFITDLLDSISDGTAAAQRRVLLLNGSVDRETSAFTSCADLMTSLLSIAADEIRRAALADERDAGDEVVAARFAALPTLITDVVYPQHSPLVTPDEAAAGVVEARNTILTTPSAPQLMPSVDFSVRLLHCPSVHHSRENQRNVDVRYNDDELVSILLNFLATKP